MADKNKTFEALRQARRGNGPEKEKFASEALSSIGQSADGEFLRTYLLSIIGETCFDTEHAVLIRHNARREFASELLTKLDAPYEKPTQNPTP